MVIKVIKNENKMEKIQKSINKDVETTQLLKLKIFQKESIAKYLKQKSKSVSQKIKWWK